MAAGNRPASLPWAAASGLLRRVKDVGSEVRFRRRASPRTASPHVRVALRRDARASAHANRGTHPVSAAAKPRRASAAHRPPGHPTNRQAYEDRARHGPRSHRALRVRIEASGSRSPALRGSRSCHPGHDWRLRDALGPGARLDRRGRRGACLRRLGHRAHSLSRAAGPARRSRRRAPPCRCADDSTPDDCASRSPRAPCAFARHVRGRACSPEARFFHGPRATLTSREARTSPVRASGSRAPPRMPYSGTA